MIRRIVDDLYRISSCGNSEERVEHLSSDPPDWYEPGEEVHAQVNAYLIKGEESLLFDTLGPTDDDIIINGVKEILDGDSLDYVVLSHLEPPHAANALKLKEEFPEVEIIASKHASHGEMHDLYWIEDAKKVDDGETLDLGKGYEVEYHITAFTDMGMTIGMFEARTETLFTVDWLGAYHMGGTCDYFADELDGGVSLDQLVRFHSGALYWFKYADTDTTQGVIDDVIERYNPSIIAPAHGLVIRKNPKEYLLKMNDIIESISEGGQLGKWAPDTVKGK